MLHIHNGDASAEVLKKSDVGGEHFAWREALLDGPTPADLAGEAWRAVRARHLAEAYGVDEAEARRGLVRLEAGLDDVARHDEVVLWFEHDLFCQVNLLYILDWFSSREPGNTRLSLVNVGEFPGVDDFRGLGQLTPAQMASLLGARVPLTERELGLGADAWAAYRSPDPRAITSLLGRDTSALPFLRSAMLDHLARFPSTSNGLGRVEHEALAAVGSGREAFDDVFRAFGDARPTYGYGDFQFWTELRRLAGAREPALVIEGAAAALASEEFRRARLRLTETGRAVLAGERDFVELNGVDRWLGGVHLRGDASPWRWDDEAQALREGG
jgi:hypothetical protein